MHLLLQLAIWFVSNIAISCHRRISNDHCWFTWLCATNNIKLPRSCAQLFVDTGNDRSIHQVSVHRRGNSTATASFPIIFRVSDGYIVIGIWQNNWSFRRYRPLRWNVRKNFMPTYRRQRTLSLSKRLSINKCAGMFYIEYSLTTERESFRFLGGRQCRWALYAFRCDETRIGSWFTYFATKYSMDSVRGMSISTVRTHSRR